jgi:PhnB protein
LSHPIDGAHRTRELCRFELDAGFAAQCEAHDAADRREDVMTRARSPLPEGFHSVTPHLIVDDAASAIDWYKKAIGAEEKMRSHAPDGKIMHAELQIGNSRLMLNDPMGGGRSPKALGGTPVGFWIYVDDCDALFNQAVANGAQVAPGPMGQMSDQFWGDRSGTFTDPFGYQWTIATRKEDLTKEEMDRRAQDFFKQFAPQA